MSPEKASPSNGWLRLIPLGLFVFAFLIRMAGIGWGLPSNLHTSTYHPDEPEVLGLAESVDTLHGKWVPQVPAGTTNVYNYGTLFPLVDNVAIQVGDTYGGVPKTDDATAVLQYTRRLYLTGRIVSALAGAATVSVAFLLLLEITSMTGALAGALMLCFASAHVVQSRFGTVDIFGALLVAVSLLFAVRLVMRADISPRATLLYPLWGGLFAGLAAGTKYTGGLALLAVIAAIALAKRPNMVLHVGIAVLVCLVAFVLATPGVMLDHAAFMRDFGYELQHTATGHGLVFEGTSSGFLYHIGNLISGFGSIATGMGAAGLVYAAYRKHKWAFVLLAFMVPFYVLIGRADVKFLRYTFPLYVGLCAGIGYAFGAGQRMGGRGRWAVAAGILAIGGADLTLAGARGTAVMTAWMSGADPRDTAAAYLKDKATQNPNLVVGLVSDPWFYTAALYPTAGVPRAVPLQARDQAMAEATAPRVARFIPAPPEGRKDWDVRLLTETRPYYVTFSSFESEDLERLSREKGLAPEIQQQVNDFQAFKNELVNSYVFDRAFGAGYPLPHDLEYIQPTIYVWKRKVP